MVDYEKLLMEYMLIVQTNEGETFVGPAWTGWMDLTPEQQAALKVAKKAVDEYFAPPVKPI